MSKSVLMIGAAAIAVTAYVLPASAQQTSDEKTELRQDVVTVTSRKSEENIQDIPISVSVFDGDALREQNISGISDLSDLTPGFQQQQSFGRDGDRPVIRGTSNILVSEGKVGVFMDGVPFFGDSSSLDLSNLERVEITKGPQSTVFGRGTLSGAINYVTRRPGDEPYEGLVSLELGSDGRQQLAGYANFRVNDMLAFSINGKTYDFDGAFDNTLGGKLGAQSTDTYSGAVFLDPTSDIQISARYIYAEDDDGLFPINLTPASANNCFLNTRGYICGTAPVPTSYSLNTSDILRPGIYREAKRGILSADWDIASSGYTLSYQGGLTDVYEISGVDQTYNGDSAFFIGPICGAFIPNGNCSVSAFNDTNSSQRTASTHEVRLSSPTSHAFRWRVGAFTSHEQRKPLAEFLELTEFGPDTLSDIVEIDNVAYFGGIEYDFTDKLTVGLELRHATDDIKNKSQQYVASQYIDPALILALPLPFYNPPNPNQVVGSTAARDASFKSTAPRLTVDYKMSEDVLLYGQYAEGNSPGGFNPLDAPKTTFEEEKLKAIEFGAKTSLFGFDRLNLALFRNEFDNQVLSNTYTTGAGGVNSFSANIGQTEIYGLELEFSKYLTDNWIVYGSYGYLDAEITKGVDRDEAILKIGAVCVDLAAPGCAAAGDLSGKVPPLVSKHQGAIGTRFDFNPTQNDKLDFYVGGDVTYLSSFYAQIHNLLESGDATKLNLRAGMEYGNFSFQVWGRNVLDDDTPAGILRYVNFTAPRSPADRTRGFGISPAAPTMWGATATVRF